MIKFEGDYTFIDVKTENDYTNYNGMNQNGIKVKISASYMLQAMHNKINQLEHDLNAMKEQSQKNLLLIENNPAVREAYKNYLTMVELAKEHNHVAG